MSKPGPGNIVWFDLYVDDPNAAMSFYSKLFGWTFNPMLGMEDIRMIDTGEGSPHGSLLKRDADAPPQHPQSTGIYVQVEHLGKSFELATALGASTFVPPSPIPGTGDAFVLLRDPEQNMIGLVAPISTISAVQESTLTGANE